MATGAVSATAVSSVGQSRGGVHISLPFSRKLDPGVVTAGALSFPLTEMHCGRRSFYVYPLEDFLGICVITFLPVTFIF